MAPVLTQPPDPNPKTPRLKCPPGAIDCHVHVFGPASKYPFNPGAKYISADALPETEIALQDRLGISMAVVVSGGGYGRNYRHLADVLEKHADRFRGVALLPAEVTRDEIARLNRLGVRATRFVSAAHGGAMPPLSPEIAALVADFGWHVEYYLHRTEIIDFGPLLLKLPNRAIVLDHFAHIPAAGGIGQPAFQALLRLLDSGRVWVKLSGPMRCTEEEPPYASVTPMARTLVAHAPERLVWGSDWPHVNLNNRTMPNDGDLVDLIADWIPDAVARQRIMVDNPRALYDIARPLFMAH
ncbi:MAG: amidohydrolase family protein [Bauldia sp.]